MSVIGVESMDLDAAQEAAVSYSVNSPLVINACAGAGKTTVLIRRILFLISKGFRPEKILVITFSRKAMNEIRERLLKINPDAARVNVVTFHSFAYRILNKPPIITDKKQFSILKTAAETVKLEDDIHLLASFITWQKNNLIPVGGEYDFSRFPEKHAKLSSGYAEYEKIKSNANENDFDDLLIKLNKLLENDPKLTATLLKAYTYVQVDEFQDTCIAQKELLKKIASHGRITVVGDSRQAIYSWRAARPDILINFNKEWPNANVLFLNTNYRCAGPIVRLADAFIRSGSIDYPGTISPAKQDGPPIDFRLLLDEQEEAAEITKTVQELAKQGVPFHEMAVLYRTNSQAAAIEDAFLEAGIPYGSEGKCFYSSLNVLVPYSYFKIIYAPDDADAFIRAANYPPRNIPLKYLEERIKIAKELNVPLWDTLTETNALSGVRQFWNTLQAILPLYPKMPYYTLHAIISITECTRFLRSQSEPADEDSSTFLLKIAENFNNPFEFIKHIEKRRRFSKSKGGVNLLTIHAAKGLEFPYVFLIGVTDGLLPHSKSLNESCSDGVLSPFEEERRLCHVALTRAKEKLYISSSQTFCGKIMPNRRFYDTLKEISKHLEGGKNYEK